MGQSAQNTVVEHRGREQRFFRAHTALNSFAEGGTPHRRVLNPFSQSLRLTANSNSTIPACIVVLLLIGSPSDISRFIIPVVVDSIQGMKFRGPTSDIGKEIFKALPSLADLNAASSVMAELLVVGVLAPRFHRPPNRVLRGYRYLTVCAFSMPSAGFPHRNTKFAAQTPAGLRAPVSKHEAGDSFFGTALTSANPTKLPSLSFFSCAQYNPPSKMSTFKVDFHAPVVN